MVSTGWGKRASQLLAQTTQKTIFMGSTLFRGVEGGGSPLFAPPLCSRLTWERPFPGLW